MGELLGIPEWLFATLFVVGFVAIIVAIAQRNTKRQIEATLQRRANLTREQFLELMSQDASRDASEFLWDAAIPYLDFFKRSLTPHPDDSLVDDLPIDDEVWGMDWPREWAELRGIHESNLPDWPHGWPVTGRNFGRWLDMAPA